MIRWMIFDGRDLFWFSFAGKFLREPFCRVAPRPCTPGLLSFHEESNQRRAKEDVSSLETPLRGKTAPMPSARSEFFVCGPENGRSPFSELLQSSLPLSVPIAGKC